MKKFTCLLAIVGMSVWAVSAQAGPITDLTPTAAADRTPTTPGAQTQAAGPCVQPCSYFEDFEDQADFLCGAWLGDGNQGAAGGIFETWDAACSRANGSTSEGHVVGLCDANPNPFSGTQHIRLSQDPTVGTSFTGCVIDARVPDNPTAEANTPPIGATTVSVEVSITGMFSQNFNIQPQARWMGFLTTRTLLFYYVGATYILDDPNDGAGGLAFLLVDYWDTTGAYHNYTTNIDPCTPLRCDGGLVPDAPCTNNDDCLGDGGAIPDGTCAGTINYYKDGFLIYQGITYAGLNVDQFLLYGDNMGAGNPQGMDADDVSIERSDPCPTTCGADGIEPGEECEVDDDSGCPGKCVAPGETGPNGEVECTCVITHRDPCEAQDVGNGTFQRVAHGGWFTFTADTPAMAVETCGVATYDSQLSVWSGTCDSLGLLIANDDCYGGAYFGAGSDPYASCYNGASALYFPYNACTCVPTTKGEQYWVWDDRLSGNPIGNEIVITFTKRLDCANPAGFGACCRGLGGCDDVAGPDDCTGLNDVYTDRKSCNTVGATCPAATVGACCDRLTEACTETKEGGCTDSQQDFNLGVSCASNPCTADKGACCISRPFDFECSVTKGVDCNTGVFGSTVVTYQNGVDCESSGCDLNIIPTVSEWGLVIMALLLLAGAKVYFGRRQALA